MKRKQQSLSRAFKRGNAMLEFNMVTKQVDTVWRKFTDHSGFGGWKNRHAKRALVADMDAYCERVNPSKK